MKTILVALDFSDASKSVLEAACSMALAQDAVLHILHVMEPEPSYSAYGMTPEEFPAIQTYRVETQKRAEARVNDAVAEARKLVPDVRAELMVGSPKHCIIEYAKEHAIDLIVIGTHGHGAVAALLIGSVAEGLVRKAFCPTLVIPCIS
jgi:nucleotide-binding universal stress UspA family protein